MRKKKTHKLSKLLEGERKLMLGPNVYNLTAWDQGRKLTDLLVDELFTYDRMEQYELYEAVQERR